MRALAILLALVLILPAYGHVVRPSDLIQTIGYSPAIDLRGASPDSAKAIDSLNPNLTMYEFWGLPNIGHYASWAVTVDDSEATLTASQSAFIGNNTWNESLQSVGNTTGNFTVINNTMVYL